jgi:hypothetical protein
MKENKLEQIHFRVTKTEKDKLMKKANDAGYTLSSYVKKVVFENKIVPKTDIETVLELKKIGVNINQLAKFINTFPVQDNLPYAINNLQLYIDKLNKLIANLSDN